MELSKLYQCNISSISSIGISDRVTKKKTRRNEKSKQFLKLIKKMNHSSSLARRIIIINFEDTSSNDVIL